MLTHYTNAMRKYAIFRGRASRAEFWSFYAVYLVVAVVVVILDQAYFGTVRGNSGVVFMLFGCVHILPGMAVQVRRLHDIDRSGWWIVLNLISIGFILALLRGTDGPNRFGPEPGDFDVDDPLYRRPAERSDRTVQPLHDHRATRSLERSGSRADPREPSFGPTHDDSPARPHSAPSASVRGPADLIGDIERLAALRAGGGLTEAEFEVMKAQAFSRGFER